MILIMLNTMYRPKMLFDTLSKNLERTGVDLNEIYLCARNNGGHKETWDSMIAIHRKYNNDLGGIKLYNSRKNLGNSNSLNLMLRSFDPDAGHSSNGNIDYYVIIADDLLLPDQWLRRAIEKHEELRDKGYKTGQCAFTPFPKMHGVWNEKLQVFERDHFYTVWVLPWDVFEEFGYFMAFSNYGIWDGEFGRRLHRGGRFNFALDTWKCDHLDWDHRQHEHQKTEYRKMKDREIRIASQRHDKFYEALGDKWTHLGFEMSTWEGAKQRLKIDD